VFIFPCARINIRCVVFPSRKAAGWNCGWMNSFASQALMRNFAVPEELSTAWSHAWILHPFASEEFDLSVVDRQGIKATYLYAPFPTRPFGCQLGDIQDHRKRENCQPPFRRNEPIPEFYLEPRWVLRRFAPKPRPKVPEHPDLGSWRRDMLTQIIKHKLPSYRELYVCCSYCGYGRELSLPSSASIQKISGRILLTQEWVW
jgi:hypothetical protein